MVLEQRPIVQILEALFEEPYRANSKTFKTGRFEYESVISVKKARNLSFVPLPGKLVARVIISSSYHTSNGVASVSDSARLDVLDKEFSRTYVPKIDNALQENGVRIQGASSHR